eukprot:c26352_g1_i1 orf=456-1727(+)
MERSSALMDTLPDAIVQLILSNVKNAKDVAVCSCVCKRWKEIMSQGQSLFFPRNVGDEKGIHADLIVTRMVLSMISLQELTVYCPFSHLSLLAWLSHTKSSLRKLELRVDDLEKRNASSSSMSKLDCIACSQQLQILQLWGVLLTQSPDWRCFQNLHTLEIVGARLPDMALSDILYACPMLTNLSLISCDGIRTATIASEHLKQCRLDLYGPGDGHINISASNLEVLEVQGGSWLRITGSHHLHHLLVANNSGKVKKVEADKLSDLRILSLRGVHWCWEAINATLQLATELEELSMKVEFCGDGDKLEPFPEIDFVDFFSSHLKLRSFELQGAMFAALSQKSSLNKISQWFEIGCLESAYITVRSPLNADYKLATLESLITHSPKLQKLRIRVSEMKNCENVADEFFFRLLGLKFRYDFIEIE